jgi:hypothetical protein
MHNPRHWYEYGLMRAPGLVRLALEWRAPWEYGAMLALRPLLNLAPEGDGHPVLVFPGLMASDVTTAPLRGFLETRGYAPYGWALGTNKGPREGVLQACRARLVITLGTPFTGHPKATNAWRLYEVVTGHKIGAPEMHEPLRVPPPVPTTSIYSRSDGIVAWQCSVEKEGPLHENIEVEASHFGLGFNPLSWYAIADRLAQPEEAWEPFDRSGVRGWLYRDPKRRTWY